MKCKLSFYITIEGITIRLKNVSLLDMSYVAERLADIDDLSGAEISVTSATRHYDYLSEDEDTFVDFVKKAVEYQTAHKKDQLPIDQVIAAIREDFPDFYIRRNSNAKITVQDKSNPLKKFRIFAGLLNDIVLQFEANSEPVTIEIDTIDKLLKEIDRVKNLV